MRKACQEAKLNPKWWFKTKAQRSRKQIPQSCGDKWARGSLSLIAASSETCIKES